MHNQEVSHHLPVKIHAQIFNQRQWKLIVCVYISGVLQAHSEGPVSRGREAEYRSGSTAALSLGGEQREELHRHQRLHAGLTAQRYQFIALCV